MIHKGCEAVEPTLVTGPDVTVTGNYEPDDGFEGSVMSSDGAVPFASLGNTDALWLNASNGKADDIAISDTGGERTGTASVSVTDMFEIVLFGLLAVP